MAVDGTLLDPNANTWLQLLDTELQRYVDELVPAYDPEQIILFGSKAHGAAKLWSDLDLVLVCQSELRFLDRIKDVLTRLRPRVGLDILVYTPEEFEALAGESGFVSEEILQRGQVLYERPA